MATFPDNLSIMVTDIVCLFCGFFFHFLVLKSSYKMLEFESEMTEKRDNNQMFSPSVVNLGTAVVSAMRCIDIDNMLLILLHFRLVVDTKVEKLEQ